MFCIFIVDMFKTLRFFTVALAVAVLSSVARVMAGCSGDPSLEGLGMPEFVSISAQADDNSLVLTCNYKGRVGMCGFVVTRNGEMVKKQEASTRSDGAFSLIVKNLEYDTEYTYYAWISNGSAEIHSNTGTARTEQKPIVAPQIVSVGFEADENVLTLRCTYEGDDVQGCGFYFNGSDKVPATERGSGSFSLTLRNLEYDNEYVYQAYVTSGEVEVKSSEEKARTGKMSSIPIPDAAFKAYIQDKFDLDKNGKLSMEEAEKITRLEINTFDLKIKSLEGIEYFVNLEYLKAVGHGDTQRGEVARLDLSKNTKLETLYCSFNKLEFMDLGNSSSLKYVDCSSNYLLNVNLDDHRPDFSQLTGLEYLDCHSNVDLLVWLMYNTALKYLDCSNTVGFDYVGYCTSIEYIDCSYCQVMKSYGLYLSGLKKLKTLKGDGIGLINEFDASGCENLVFDQSFFTDNEFWSIKLKGCNKLTSLDICNGESTYYIDVTDCKNLKSVKCNGRGVYELYVGGCTALTDIECYENYLHELDVSSQSKLNLKAWPQKDTFSRLWIGSGEYHYFNESGQEINPADYGTEVIVKE